MADSEEISFANIDRTRLIIATNDVLDEQDIDYWSKATIIERLQTITYLRECFYGPEATTGRVQRDQIQILDMKDLR